MVPWAHLTHCPKRHLDKFIRFCTAHGRQSPYFTMGQPFLPQNCPFTWGSAPYLLHASLAHPSPHRKWHLSWFSRLCTVHNHDRQTDHTTPSATIGLSYVILMWPNNNSNCNMKETVSFISGCRYSITAVKGKGFPILDTERWAQS